jgi:perosamine synthetase
MKAFNSAKFISLIKDFVGASQLPVGLHEPYFQGYEKKYVNECIDAGWVSSAGKFVDRFEQDLADFTGAKHVIVTVNGTAALHVSFLLAGIKPQDEVLVPALTFVATCNAISYCQAVPHFLDSEELSLGVDARKLQSYLQDIIVMKDDVCYNRVTNRPIRALCVTHIFGHPADLDAIKSICKKYNLILVEDAAEALGSYYNGRHVGLDGICGILSFNGNKIITTGGGGAILTNNKDIAAKAKHITTTAKLPHKWLYHYDCVGYNYRMPNINAALGCAQLENIKYFLDAKRKLALKYQDIFCEVGGVRFMVEPGYAKSNYWLNAIILDAGLAGLRDSILEELNSNGIGSRPIWNLMHSLPMYEKCPKMNLSQAEDLVSRVINLPSSVFLK